MIKINNLTLKYPSGKGVFDVNFEIQKGKVAGYLGPNGSGKTTTIRAIMGFMRADSGNCTINGLDCYDKADFVKKKLGYIPGEISFPSSMKCMDYIKYQCGLRGVTDLTLTNQLINRFELDTKGDINRFSKGMKQKLGIICAFLHDPEVLILDEPTSGLDPLMQNEFISLILEQKQKGKTILMSSHIFEEIERCCDDVIMIKNGKIILKTPISVLKQNKRKGFLVNTDEMDKLKSLGLDLGKTHNNGVEVYVKGNEFNSFIRKISEINITNLEAISQSLEDIFLNYYEAEEDK